MAKKKSSSSQQTPLLEITPRGTISDTKEGSFRELMDSSDNWWADFGFSVLLHASLLVLFVFKVFLSPHQPIELQRAIRVDIVDLPDKLDPNAPPLPEAPKPEEKKETVPPPPEVKVAPKPKEPTPEEINLDKKKADLNKKKQMDAIEKLKQQSALDKIKNMAAAPKKLKGAEISKGTELTGVARLEAESYLSLVDKQIRSNWALPQYLRNKGLKAEILVRFDSQGNVIAKKITRSSGVEAFDDLVEKTVDISSPVPKPPDQFSGIAENEGFLFSFSE